MKEKEKNLEETIAEIFQKKREYGRNLLWKSFQILSFLNVLKLVIHYYQINIILKRKYKYFV